MPKLVPVDHDPFAVVPPPANPAHPPDWLKSGILGAANAMFVDPIQQAGKALRGQLTENEARNFALEAAAGIIPVGRGLKAAKTGIKAYHGSPHDFDRFDMSKIGTGEGAQAYGHGLYFAESPAVAQDYKTRLSNVVGNTQTPAGAADRFLGVYGDKAEEAIIREIGEMRSIAAKLEASGKGAPQVFIDRIKNEYEPALELIRRGGYKPGGRMYEVNINAHPDQFIDWDAPLSKQPKLEQTIRRVGADPTGPGFEGPLTGAEGYRALQNKYFLDQIAGRGTNIHPDEVNAIGSQAVGKMAQEGIPGIKYLDQGSRTAGEGSRNYVVFDDKLIDILRKYGVAGLAVLPPAVAAGVQERLMPVDHDPFATTEKR